MAEDVPLHTGLTVILTTDDGTLFSCAPHEIGGFTSPRQLRWKLVAADGTNYVGPPYRPDEAEPSAVQRLVSVWWEERKALGEDGGNAQRV